MVTIETVYIYNYIHRAHAYRAHIHEHIHMCTIYTYQYGAIHMIIGIDLAGQPNSESLCTGGVL